MKGKLASVLICAGKTELTPISPRGGVDRKGKDELTPGFPLREFLVPF